MQRSSTSSRFLRALGSSPMVCSSLCAQTTRQPARWVDSQAASDSVRCEVEHPVCSSTPLTAPPHTSTPWMDAAPAHSVCSVSCAHHPHLTLISPSSHTPPNKFHNGRRLLILKTMKRRPVRCVRRTTKCFTKSLVTDTFVSFRCVR